MKSIFTDKNLKPTVEDLKKGLGKTYLIWKDLENFTKTNYPNAICEWSFSSEKFGWSYRIKDNKRVLIYLLPRDKFFKTAFVFGEKALIQIFESDISEVIKSELKNAKKNAEGKGIRIEVKDLSVIGDIQKLVKFKIAN
ncbi:MAG: DUF3788 family protein [Bacteroidota bacterium]|nr:DUF3788 family protein [Bacteroidota bacterium]